MAIVAIVGRPNVGKSSLFNRIVGKRKAIVDDQPGVTRDRIYGEAEHAGEMFLLVDTGGLLPEGGDPMSESIKKQVLLAVQESDLLVLVIDGKAGLTTLDREVALFLRKKDKPVIVAVNKIDDLVHEGREAEGYALGFPDVIGVSAAHNRNIEELLDRIRDLILVRSRPGPEEQPGGEISVAIVGRPNVGKSTLLNHLSGSERSLVTPVPGTTRDSVDSQVIIGGKPFRFIDTAGLRKKSRMDSDVEFYSLVRTHESISRADVVVLLMEGTQVCTDQDKKISGLVVDKGKGLILAVNKWDLLEKDPGLGDRITRQVREEMSFVDFAPLVFISGLTGRGLHKLPEKIAMVQTNRSRWLDVSKTTTLVRDVLAFERMPSDPRGRTLYIRDCRQVAVNPPAFAFSVNDRDIVSRSFERTAVRKIREMGNFEGSPIKVFWRSMRRGN
ncbi:MAG: ribosome biogenesis GTPase Der [Thermovirgaceae bacterium]|nr:ribosome biogenesis GTPase Der [Synergistales bacterium]HPC76111.1 ribosome biogenesis GTPase Der [Synergistales bacterium]HRS48788.1 ribosome biogenesis GTPase Der [Thermovirgaceae bacterium]HRU90992.1 ribosome biogenesis GTPase Der [Thermovirgaceae bacterium]